MALPEQFKNPDGTIKADYAEAAIAALSYEDAAGPVIGARVTLARAGLRDDQIDEIAERGRRKAQGDPPAPPSPYDEARQRAEEAEKRAEDRQRQVTAARALLDEQREPFGYDSSLLSDQEALEEAGMVAHSDPAVQRQRELDRYNQRVVSDPAFAEQELRKQGIKDFVDQWPSLSPRVRAEKAADLGLTESDLAEIKAHWHDRWTTK